MCGAVFVFAQSFCPRRCSCPVEVFGAKEESRRSFGYKGGVTRGREDHPRGEDWTSGKLMLEKRGSPITPYFVIQYLSCIIQA